MIQPRIKRGWLDFGVMIEGARLDLGIEIRVTMQNIVKVRQLIQIHRNRESTFLSPPVSVQK
jgi:hypothetical protein